MSSCNTEEHPGHAWQKNEIGSVLRRPSKVIRPSQHIHVQHPSRIGDTDTECDVKSGDHRNHDHTDQQQQGPAVSPSSPLADAHQSLGTSPAEEGSEARSTSEANQTNPAT
ncbi:hypothetical protein RRG08_016893 [Elysia crispata]|uniref:Uncharacterized protein n=1 Tax=Elysia crispata TaxID=231223 RepID=A0AAE1DFX4_9GAST|nr:hypothetical protein RRG08_016893 [Elysia crispata]